MTTMGTPPPDNPTAELRGLADLVAREGLCTCLFPVFVRGIQEDTGFEPGYEVRRASADLVAAGLHRTAEEVAELLRARADRLDSADQL
jgi:hypothetical protein